MLLNKVTKVKVHYDNCLRLSGLSSAEIDKVKSDLTFDNPVYATTKRYSRYSYTTVSPYLTYYKETRDYIEVPIGYPTSQFKVGEVTDSRVYEKIEVPEFLLTLRESQKEAVDNYLSLNEEKDLKGCIQLPTGKGKSILGLYLASALSCKTLILVHKDDLVIGWKKDIELAFGGKVDVGLIKAKSRKVGDFITIATVQTLNRLSVEELKVLFSEFSFVIQDEVHHCPSTSFGIVSLFRSRYKLGLTATPERTDGLTHVITLYHGDFCYKYKHTEDDEDILPVKVITRKHPLYFNPVCEQIPSYNGVKYKLVDLYCPSGKLLSSSQRRLSEVPYAQRPKLPFSTIDDFVVQNIKDKVCEDILSEYEKGHSCIVFFTQKEHCRLYYEYLNEHIPADDLGLFYGDNKDNASVLERAEGRRKFVTLTTYAKATEGTNVKQWEVAFFVSSINNGKNTEQAVGRIRRTKDGNKLSPVLVYDYRTPNVYSVSNHGTTRDSRYKLLKFDYEAPRIGLFSKGFRR